MSSLQNFVSTVIFTFKSRVVPWSLQDMALSQQLSHACGLMHDMQEDDMPTDLVAAHRFTLW